MRMSLEIVIQASSQLPVFPFSKGHLALIFLASEQATYIMSVKEGVMSYRFQADAILSRVFVPIFLHHLRV